MTLHEEIVAILKEFGHEMTTKEIAEIVNKRKKYIKRDGSDVTPFQIHGRTKNYPQLFTRDKTIVGLVEWKQPKVRKEVSKKFSLLDEIVQLLKDNEDELSTKVIADSINKRFEFEKNEELPTTAGKVFLITKSNPNIFVISGDNVGLVEWNEVDESVSDDYRYYFEGLKEQVQGEHEVKRLSIKNIGVANFKSYNTLQELYLKPITLLFGPNSAGKSSLIHSLLYLQNAFSTKELDAHYMKISGDSVDLGGFRQLIHKRDNQRSLEFKIDIDVEKGSESIKNNFPQTNSVTVRFEIRQPLKQRTKRKVIRVEGETLFYEEVPTEEFIAIGKPKVQKFEILTDGDPLLNIGLKQNLIFRVDYLNLQNKLIRRIIEALILSSSLKLSIEEKDWTLIEESMDLITNELYTGESLFIPRQLKKSKESIYEADNTLKNNQTKIEVDLINSLKLYLPFSLSEIIESVYNELDSQIGNLVYLGPIRSYPARHLAFTNNNDPNWVSGGANAWEILRDDGEIRNKINEWMSSTGKLNTKYKLVARKYIDPQSKDFEDQLSAAAHDIDFELSELQEWNGEDGIVEKVSEKVNEKDAIEGINDLVLVDQTTNTVVSHRDVGFGISQVIPVLVAAFANKGKTILIEQPEIHLHPALQAELGDVVIESALGKNKNNLILENHSEHLMLRILRRIRETSANELPEGKMPIRPEDVSVVYLQNAKDGTILTQIPITADGDFAKRWPEGFFPERAEELM